MTIAVFLMTDIEGSTRRWSDDPVGMRRALDRHDAAVRAEIEAHGGTVFKHTGDGVLAVHPTARSAVAAGVGVQRRLGSMDWGDVAPLPVRVVVAAGEAEPVGDDWFGPALNRGSRLLGLAHGGQVLVSDSAAAMARDGLPVDLVLTDLGVHHLRDLPHPERVWQVAGEGVRRAFPPLRSTGVRRGNLPTQLTSFVGREDEVAALVDRLAVERSLTLVGPGGVGKTRLALQAAAVAAGAFPDGVWVVELAPLRDPDAIDHALASVLDLGPRAGSSPQEVVLDAVRRRRALIVLDNCEHLLRAAGARCARLLEAAPGLRLLATSREPLRVPGEHVWAVRPLSADGAAAQLFVERAAASDRSLLDVEGDAEAVRTICRRLDGMPLAIELAAARNGALTPAQIASRLDRRFGLLRRSAGEEDRHASLQATLDWSFELLDADLQRRFCRLGVFPHDFDLDATVAVCADGDDELVTLDRLEALVDKSLVVAEHRPTGSRFSLLETMRQYAVEHLGAGDLDALRERHARHAVGRAEAAWAGCRGVDEAEWLGRVADEKADLRAAFGWLLEHGDVDAAVRLTADLMPYSRARMDGEVWDWVRTALDLPGALDHPLAPRLLAHAAYAAVRGGDPAGGEHDVRRGLARQDALGLPPEPSLATGLAASLTFGGRAAEALPWAEVALEQAERRGAAYAFEAADAAYGLCFVTLAAGGEVDPDLAGRALAAAERAGSPSQLANAKWALGVALIERDPARGVEILREAEGLARRVDYRFVIGLAPAFAALVRAEIDLHAGLRDWADALGYLAATGNRLGVRATLRAATPAFLGAGRPDLVALADGAALPFAVRPRAEAAAVAAAGAEIGGERYDELRRQGEHLDDEALIALLRREIAAVLGPG